MFSLPALSLFLGGPLAEEIGWRGYFLPELFKKYSVLTSSLIIGILWGIWHYPLYYGSYLSSFDSALLNASQTTISSIIISIIFVHTRGSILIAIIYHWLLNILPMTFTRVFINVASEFEILQLIGKLLIIFALVQVIGIKNIEQAKTNLISQSA